MGSALLRGWLDKGISQPNAITVVEPAGEARAALTALGVRVLPDAEVAIDGGNAPDLVLLAVKPQVMDETASYGALARADTVFLSIAAGKTTEYFQGLFGSESAIVRAMPNTPAQVGRGITALFATERVGGAGKALCAELMGAVGEVVWIDDESLMDAVTAVSGSGPAYVFYLLECLATAGREAGLDEELAGRLARATVAGSAELARLSEEPVARLREQVTSPGGTTAAALEVLMGSNGFEAIIVSAVQAAAARSRELAG